MTSRMVPFAPGMWDEAGALFAARFRRLRERRPELPAAFTEPEGARAAVQHAWCRGGAEGVAALRGDRQAAFCIDSRRVDARIAWAGERGG